MPVDSIPTKKERRQIALLLGGLFFCLYLLIYRGGFHSIDEVSMFAVTESMAKFGRFDTDQIAWTQWTTGQAEAQGFFGTDGHVYSKKGLGLSLAQLPLYWLALLLPGLGMLQTVSLLNALITATSGVLIFMFVSRLNFGRYPAMLSALVFGTATIVLVYAKYLFSEPLAGFLLLLAAYMLYVYRQEGGLRHIFAAGLAAGLAVVTRANNIFLLPAFGLYLLWIELRPLQTIHRPPSMSHLLRMGLMFILALTIPGLMLLGYNAVRSGNPLQTGYDLSLFSPNIPLGLYKLLFSPLRGLFIYSPILLLSLPGWWLLRKSHPAEAWLFAGLVGITLTLFSAWSSGEGLSWGSRFLVPIIPFLAISLAPILHLCMPPGARTSVFISYFLPLIVFLLLAFSLIIQMLAVTINPWVYLAKLQEDFGGEFFLENTDALTDFRYSQILGQFQAISVQNSDVVWWQPWGFDLVAFSISLSLVLLWAWFLWQASKMRLSSQEEAKRPNSKGTVIVPNPTPAASNHKGRAIIPRLPSMYALLLLTLILTYYLMVRYNKTDLQFGPLDDAYSQTLVEIAAQSGPGEAIVTVAPNHYHVPMNRFKIRQPLVGFAQQPWPMPESGQTLLTVTTSGLNAWLVTLGFPSAAPDNAAEQWLALNTYKAIDTWQPDDVRLVQFGLASPDNVRPTAAMFDNLLELRQVQVLANVSPGQTITTEFVWQALAELEKDYNIFVQLLSSEGVLIAQYDGPPNGGYAPTSGWIVRQPVISRQAVPLPAHLPPGEYHLIAGLYQPASGQRLLLENGADFVELGNITVQPLDEP